MVTRDEHEEALLALLSRAHVHPMRYAAGTDALLVALEDDELTVSAIAHDPPRGAVLTDGRDGVTIRVSTDSGSHGGIVAPSYKDGYMSGSRESAIEDAANSRLRRIAGLLDLFDESGERDISRAALFLSDVEKPLQDRILALTRRIHALEQNMLFLRMEQAMSQIRRPVILH